MKRIENWLNGRTAAIALHGMSIRGLRNHPFYRERDWAWATVNRWQVTENVLWPDLAPEQRPLGLVWMTSETEMAMIGNTLTTFLSRRESNLAAITLSAAHANPAVYNTLSRGELRDQVVVVPTPPKVSTSHPCGLAALNSAIALARVLIRCGARRLIFFGLDGVPPGAETAAEVASYVDERVFRNGNRDTQIARDTVVINESAAALLAQSALNAGSKIEVYNSSPGTYITAFPVIPHAQAVELA